MNRKAHRVYIIKLLDRKTKIIPIIKTVYIQLLLLILLSLSFSFLTLEKHINKLIKIQSSLINDFTHNMVEDENKRTIDPFQKELEYYMIKNMLTVTTVTLPTEILCKILIQSFISIKSQAKRCRNPRYNQGKRPYGTNILVLNKHLFELIAPAVFEPHYYATIPIMSTENIKRYKNFDDYMKNTFFNNFKFTDETNGPSYQLHENYRYLRGEDNFRISRCHNSYEQAQLAKYELLLSFPDVGNDIDAFKKQGRYVFSLQKMNDLKKFLEKIMNNENSVMRKFVKSFTVDLLFLDEFQTARPSQDTLFGRALKKYFPNGHGYLSIKTTPFKALCNFVSTKPLVKNRDDGEELDRLLEQLHHDENGENPLISEEEFLAAKKDEDFKMALIMDKFKNHFINRQYSYEVSPYFLVPGDFEEDDWHEYKERTIWAEFIKFFSHGGRAKMSKLTSKSEVHKVLESDLFTRFKPRSDGTLTRVGRRLKLSNWGVHNTGLIPDIQMDRQKARCAEISHSVFSRTTRSIAINLPLPEDYLTELVDGLLQACTSESCSHIDRSLLAFSLKNNFSLNNKLQAEGFEQLKPKMIVINKPAGTK